MLHNLDEEERIKTIITCLDHCFALGIKINEVISRLTEKRVTLEEKMIRTYFHRVAANLAEISGCVHGILAAAYGDEGSRLEEKTRLVVEKAGSILPLTTELSDKLVELEKVVDDLLKVLRYDLNFLEQYYEYGLYTRLTNEQDFRQMTEELLVKLKAI